MKHLLTLAFTLFSQQILFAQYYEQVGALNFEDAPVNCQVILDTSASNLWQIGTPEKPFFGNAYSTPNAILTDTIHQYPIANHSSFTLKFANDADYTEYWNYLSISFWHKFQMDTLHDFGSIYWSPDTTGLWFPMKDTCCIMTPDSYPSSWAPFEWYYPLLDNSHNNIVTGMQDWTYSVYVWNWYLPVGPGDDPFFPDTIYVRFDFNSDSTEESLDGWMIDDISIDKALWFGTNDLHKANTNLKTYPNPVTDRLYFALEGTERASNAHLINSIGISMKSASLPGNQSNFDVSDLPRGIYFLMIETTNGEHATARIVLE